MICCASQNTRCCRISFRKMRVACTPKHTAPQRSKQRVAGEAKAEVNFCRGARTVEVIAHWWISNLSILCYLLFRSKIWLVTILMTQMKATARRQVLRYFSALSRFQVRRIEKTVPCCKLLVVRAGGKGRSANTNCPPNKCWESLEQRMMGSARSPWNIALVSKVLWNMVDFHSLNLWMDRHLLHVWGDEDPFATSPASQGFDYWPIVTMSKWS